MHASVDPLTWSAFRIAGGYAVLAGLWTGLSDAALQRWVDPSQMAAGSLWNGLVFVSLTALLLFAVTRAQLRSRVATERRLVRRLERRQEQLRLQRHRAAARDEERRRSMARDVHDGVGQVLAATKMALHAGQPERASELLDRGIHEVRQLARHLRPATLDHAGLGAALEQLAHESTTDAVPVRSVVSSRLPELPPERAIHVYRIAQEALTNALRHAAAQVVHMSLTCRDDRLVLAIDDDGIGLDAEVTARVGLHSMQERADLLDAELSCAKRAVGGTRVELVVPVP